MLLNYVRSRPLGMQPVGRLPLLSGKLVICDGMDGWGHDFITIPPGNYEVWIEYGRPARKTDFFSNVIDRVLVTNADSTSGQKKEVGHVGVDSAKVLLGDHDDLAAYWEYEGPLRIGEVRADGESPTPAELISKQFGLDIGPVSIIGNARIRQKISKSLEEEITQYLQAFPRFERNTFLYFSVFTGNTFDRFNCSGRRYGMLPIDSAGSAYMAMAQTGFGDGVYPISVSEGVSSGCTVQADFRDTYTEQFVDVHFSHS